MWRVFPRSTPRRRSDNLISAGRPIRSAYPPVGIPQVDSIDGRFLPQGFNSHGSSAIRSSVGVSRQFQAATDGALPSELPGYLEYFRISAAELSWSWCGPP